MKTNIYKISDRGFVKEHEYMLRMNFPKKLAEWDVWDYWESERFISMMDYVKAGSIFFDIGAEFGAISAMIQKYLKPKMVLFEPTTEFFANIKLIWQMNGLEEPIKIFNGFISDKTRLEESHELKWQDINPMEIEAMAYLNLNNEKQRAEVSEITIDDYCKEYEIFPDVLNIDVEGAEFDVINGAVSVLKNHKPLVWMSIHPDLLEKYGHTEKDILDRMKKYGYSYRLLGIDHEKHYFFQP